MLAFPGGVLNAGSDICLQLCPVEISPSPSKCGNWRSPHFTRTALSCFLESLAMAHIHYRHARALEAGRGCIAQVLGRVAAVKGSAGNCAGFSSQNENPLKDMVTLPTSGLAQRQSERKIRSVKAKLPPCFFRQSLISTPAAAAPSGRPLLQMTSVTDCGAAWSKWSCSIRSTLGM